MATDGTAVQPSLLVDVAAGALQHPPDGRRDLFHFPLAGAHTLSEALGAQRNQPGFRRALVELAQFAVFLHREQSSPEAAIRILSLVAQFDDTLKKPVSTPG